MPRALAILKYVPCMLCTLLLVAWAVSVPYSMGAKVGIPGYKGQLWTGLDLGDWMLHFSANVDEPWHWGGVRRPDQQIYSRPWFGQLRLHHFSLGEDRLVLPLPLIVTALLPFAIAPFIRFRFPLWSYFIWTGFIATELAYYLRT